MKRDISKNSQSSREGVKNKQSKSNTYRTKKNLQKLNPWRRTVSAQNKIPRDNKQKIKQMILLNKKKSAPSFAKIEQKECKRIVNSIGEIQIVDDKSFKELWQEFTQCIKGHIKQMGLKLEHSTKVGQMVLQNGNFWITYSNIVKKNCFVSERIFMKTTFEENRQRVLFAGDKFHQHFMSQMKQLEKVASPHTNQRFNLKRPILKSASSKKIVSFPKKEQLQYPADTSYTKIKNAQKEQRINHCKKHLDSFEISDHDFYLLNQVQVTGVIEKYKDNFGVIQFKDRRKGLSKKGVVILSEANEWDTRSIKKLADRYKSENLCFVDLNGKCLDAVWLEHLQPNSSTAN